MFAPPYITPFGGDDPWSFSFVLLIPIYFGARAHPLCQDEISGCGFPELSTFDTFYHGTPSGDFMSEQPRTKKKRSADPFQIRSLSKTFHLSEAHLCYIISLSMSITISVICVLMAHLLFQLVGYLQKYPASPHRVVFLE